MSSHHFVKEHQDPALIIANGQACGMPLLEQLLEWSPYVIVLDGAIEKVNSLGIKYDVVLGDFDSKSPPTETLADQPNIEMVYRPDQNKTDLEKALDFLIEKGQKTVNIVWATGYRLDHALNNVSIIGKYSHLINAVILDDYSKVFVLPKTFNKYYTKGQLISLFAMGTVHGIETKGLLYNLNMESLAIDGRSGTSNACKETGMVEIKHNSGVLVLMECAD